MSEAETQTKQPRRLDVRSLAIAGAAIAGAIGWQHFSERSVASSYDCSSLVSEVVSISDTNKSALVPVRIIDVVEGKTLSTADDRVECSGLAMLSNGEQLRINYRAYVEYDKWWIKYEPAV